jgi:hypothetical protein
MSPRIERIGRELISSRELLLWDVTDAAEISRFVLPASSTFVCLLAWNADAVSNDNIARVARAVLDAGCCYVCCWGPRCQTVHDIFDEVAIERSDGHDLIMSTWHEDEPLTDAIWFSVFCAEPDASVGSCGAVLGISIDNPSWAAEIRRAMLDPAAFSAEVSQDL